MEEGEEKGKDEVQVGNVAQRDPLGLWAHWGLRSQEFN